MLPMFLVRLPRPKRRRSRREARCLTTRRGGAKNPPSRGSESKATGNERPFKVDREELGRFDLKRAGLPDMSIESAAKYIDEHRASRPWLAMTDRASPEARRIIAAMDAAGGHAHIRHEGWVTEEANRRRVAYREDPAQLDPEKRTLGIDGLRPNDSPHRCRTTATRITDPDAFATAFVRGVEHLKSGRRWTCHSILRTDPIRSRSRSRNCLVRMATVAAPDGGWSQETAA